jgi:ligand-binding SRPBCC domain-containing protein
MVIKETITINSSLEKVWDTFTDLACWVNWNTVLKDVRTKGRSLTDGKSLKCTLRPFFLNSPTGAYRLDCEKERT